MSLKTSPHLCPDSVTHVLVGYSKNVLDDLDAFLPEESVLVLEEPEVITARRVSAKISRHPSAALLLPAPCQDESFPERFVESVLRPGNVRAVIPSVEYGVVATAALADAWRLPGASLSAARNLRDKIALRTAADRAGIPQPRWTEVCGPEEVRGFADSLGVPCVLKPANRQASLGVRFLEVGEDTREAWEHTTTANEASMRADYANIPRFMVEERVDGPEVSVEVLVDEGTVGFTNVTAKAVQDFRYPVELGHTVPALVPRHVIASLTRRMEQLVAATGFRSGVLHAEWILAGGDSPYLVECAGRPPGDRITTLIDLAYGGSLLRDLVALLEGGSASGPRRACTGAAIRFLRASPGVVEEIEGVDGLGAMPGTHDFRVSVTEGDTVHDTTSSWDRVGYVIATGGDPAEASANAERAADSVTIRARPSVASAAPRY
ncbi:hypothetical protein GCM10007079_07200 [Nocardiopsis terrae]|uniref:Biotin carboxylase n=1 Tax=Nocardiopsis terrae TaxID=372655 RepID=A0ABR9HP24_9ACTN|nr:ATP-grasp domain-containing protein [Nocardiopsis terrae]MBE1460765.1 biotin carboxylase [Nocardiopsis terrae]GHC73353.1 hypothetical protein GCM10007079_07200 [Nocardiopsis terrae]